MFQIFKNKRKLVVNWREIIIKDCFIKSWMNDGHFKLRNKNKIYEIIYVAFFTKVRGSRLTNRS